VYLCVPYDADNKQPLFRYTAFTDLSSYCKQGLVTYFGKPQKYYRADHLFPILDSTSTISSTVPTQRNTQSHSLLLYWCLNTVHTVHYVHTYFAFIQPTFDTFYIPSHTVWLILRRVSYSLKRAPKSDETRWSISQTQWLRTWKKVL